MSHCASAPAAKIILFHESTQSFSPALSCSGFQLEQSRGGRCKTWLLLCVALAGPASPVTSQLQCLLSWDSAPPAQTPQQDICPPSCTSLGRGTGTCGAILIFGCIHWTLENANLYSRDVELSSAVVSYPQPQLGGSRGIQESTCQPEKCLLC